MDWNDDLDRRTFLRQLGLAGLAAGAGGLGCSPETADSAPDADALADGYGRDSAVADVADALADARPDAGPDATDVADAEALNSALTKPPFTQVTGPQSVRVRFETATDTPLAVRLEGPGGMGTETQPTTSTREVDFEWPIDKTNSLPVEHRDEPGTYTLQEATFQELDPGKTYRWVVHLGNGDEITGEVRPAPPAEAEFRLGWIADTMAPNSEDTGPLLADQSPDLIVHGGDIQYMTNPFDTYNGLFQALSAPMQTAPTHFCVGNHERESQNEFELFYERLFAVGERDGQPADYHAFTYGGVRFILANSENDFGADGAQFDWLKAELQAAADDPNVRYPVVAFHRPFFTFSNSSPSFSTRDVFHPLFRDFEVPLVLTGHNHCYERFEADGVTYVVDGGGGALGYNLNSNREEVLMERPADADRRKAAARGFGVTTVDFKSDDTLQLTRVNVDGSEADSVTIG